MSERGNYSIHSILGDADPAVAQTEEERILLKRYQSIYRARLSRFVQTSEAEKEYHSVSKLIPSDRLNEAVSQGHTEIWELAEYFEVTEDFMRKAVCYYTHGNLATECSF